MKQLIITIALLLMPISATYLHAQENEHAQAMHTAFREMIYRKLPKNISSKWVSDSEDSLSRFFDNPDGGGLVPKNKIHEVKLGKDKVEIGPNYLDTWNFEFNNVPDDPNLPLRQLLDAFDKQAPYASSYYSYVGGDEQGAFPGVRIAYGEDGQTASISLHPMLNVRIIGFKDDDGFRSTYLLEWWSYEEDEPIDNKHKYYGTTGNIYEFHCPKLKSIPQIKPYDSDEELERLNVGFKLAQDLLHEMRKNDPERVKALDTDSLYDRIQYNYITMAQQLYDEPRAFNLKTSYEALHAKLALMTDMGSTATTTEQKAICYTLLKEVESYPFMLSKHDADELIKMTNDIAKNMSEEEKKLVERGQLLINAHRNLTADIDSLSDNDQDYLNRNHWTVIHQPIGCQSEEMFTARGEHYSGDLQTGYLHVHRDNYGSGLRIENTLKNLRPGRYRISAVVRAKKTNSGHSGLLVFAQVGDKTVQREIPADGDTGGNVWFSGLSRFGRIASRMSSTGEAVNGRDINKASAHGGMGYGWNRIFLDEINVTADHRNSNLTYGVTLDRDIVQQYGKPSNWFSACDFIIERIGD